MHVSLQAADPAVCMFFFECYEGPGGGSWMPLAVAQALVQIRNQHPGILLVADETLTAPWRQD
jgi:hypothetical protein